MTDVKTVLDDLKIDVVAGLGVETIDNLGNIVYVEWANIPEYEQKRLCKTLDQLRSISKSIAQYEEEWDDTNYSIAC